MADERRGGFQGCLRAYDEVARQFVTDAVEKGLVIFGEQ